RGLAAGQGCSRDSPGDSDAQHRSGRAQERLGPVMPAEQTSSLAAELQDRRAQFKAFLVARVGNEADAEDILQNGLIKALQRSHELRDETKLTAWFYQVLRHAIIDHFRSRKSAAALERLWTEDLAAPSHEVERALC